MYKINRLFLILFIYFTFFLRSICSNLLRIQLYITDITLKKNSIVIALLYQILIYIIIISVILLYHIFFIWFLIPLTSKNMFECLKKFGKIIILILCCIFILYFRIFRYLFITISFIWHIRYQLINSYKDIKVYNIDNKKSFYIVMILFMFSQFLHNITKYLMSTLYGYLKYMGYNLSKLPLH